MNINAKHSSLLQAEERYKKKKKTTTLLSGKQNTNDKGRQTENAH